MNKKLLLTASFSVLCSIIGLSQQDKLTTNFIFDKMSLNPGSTGLEEGICGTTIYRNQWDRINGAPNSAILNIEANMNRFFPGGLGISFYHDAIGFNRQNNVLLNYSYPLEIGDAGKLGIGLGVGIVNFGMNPEWVPPTTAIDNSLPVGWNSTNLDLNFGLYFRGDNDYYFGLSSTHLSESLLKQTVGGVDYQYLTKRHYYIMGGKKFSQIGPGDIDAQVLLKTEMIKFQADVMVRYMYAQMLNGVYGGLLYRSSDAVSLLLGCSPIQNFTVGYSYDINTHKLAGVSRGSHEVVLKYCYFLPPPPIQKSKHPRWL